MARQGGSQMRWTSAALLVLSTTGCANLSEETWNETLAQAQCDWQKRCAKVDFFYSYDSIDECESSFLDYLESYSEFMDHCEWDKENARECLDELNKSCQNSDVGDIWNECLEVWDCALGL